jgi:hypothetical protein
MFCKGWKITENKTLETQLSHWEEWSWFNIEAKWTRKQDHAGFQFNVEILGFYFHIWLCDNRHWDHENNAWYTEENEPRIWGSKISNYRGADGGTLGPDD